MVRIRSLATAGLLGGVLLLGACEASAGSTPSDQVGPPTPTSVATLAPSPPQPAVLELTPGHCSTQATVVLPPSASGIGHYTACVRSGATITVRLVKPRFGSWVDLAGDATVVRVEQVREADGSIAATLHVRRPGHTTVSTHTVVQDGVGMPERPWLLDLEIR